GTTLTETVAGTEIVLDRVVNDLLGGRTLLVADATSAEPVTIDVATLTADGQRTVLTLVKPGLTKAYDRATTSIYANVALSTHGDDGGTTTVQFGDGNTGARLPMGRENVTATYRKGVGLPGLVKAGQLTLLMTRPLGVRGVTNPMPSSGAQDPQPLADARTN